MTLTKKHFPGSQTGNFFLNLKYHLNQLKDDIFLKKKTCGSRLGYLFGIFIFNLNIPFL